MSICPILLSTPCLLPYSSQAAKISRKTGFKEAELDKARSKFLSFFGGAPAKSPASAAPPSSGVVDLTCPREDARGTTPLAGPRGGTLSTATTPGPARRLSMAGAGTPATAPRRDRTFDELFLKPEPHASLDALRGSVRDRTEAVDAALGPDAPPVEAAALWRDWLRAAKRARRQLRPESALGLPPSWARRRNQALEVAREHHSRSVAAGVDPAQVKTWRRKLIWFPADSARPAFYGSVGERAAGVGPRRCLGRDPALDYEIMSDLDWEEEPEGSSLSDCDGTDAGSDAGDESDNEGSFIIADGYLSEDEGIRSDDDLAQLESADEHDAQPGLLVAGGAQAGAGPADLAQTLRLAAQLAALAERAKRAGQALVVSRLAPAPPSAREQAADPELLGALPVIAGPDQAVRVVAPGEGEDLEAADDHRGADGAQPDPGAAEAGSKRAAPAQWDRPEALLPELMLMIRDEPHVTKKQV